MTFRRFRRLLRINHIFLRHDLDELTTAIHLFRPYRFLINLMPWRWVRRERPPVAVRLRQALEELGPIFVKFGQMLSTRPDLLSEDMAKELSRLQDRVPPFPGEKARKIIEDSLECRLEDIFVEFQAESVASASVAQVHFARLHDGSEVAVKVLRPGIERVIQRDLELLYTLARLAMRYWPEARRLRPVEVVDEFAITIRNELDLQREAANASQLKSNFEDSHLLYVARVYWDYTRKDVLVMERIYGIPVNDIDALKSAGVDLRQLAHNGVEIFFTQAFRDGFFHADMHPGNIFVAPDGQYRAVDFGIMGSLGEQDKRYLAENFLGFFNRDYRAVAEAHLRAGWVPEDTRVEDFEAAIRSVCEPIFAKPIKDISFGRLLLRLFQTARQFRMEIQPQLVLLQKTMFQIEGLGRQLYPDLDLWVTAKPYLEKWMREQMGPRAFVRAVRKEMPRLWQVMPEIPGLVHELLRQQHARGRHEELETPSREARFRQERQGQFRNLLLTIGGAGTVATAVLAGFSVVQGHQTLLWAAAATGVTSLFSYLLSWRLIIGVKK